MSESIPGLWPGEVASYDGDARTCRVRVPGLTDGSSTLLEAVFLNPLGDRATDANSKSHTEILIKPDDPVWLMFEGGDPRFPIIMGFRTPRTGNPVNWRRWHHANIEMTADNELIINATKVTWNVSGDVIEHIGGDQKTDVAGLMKSTAGTSTHNATTHVLTAQTTINGAISTGSGPGGVGASFQGPVNYQNGAITYAATITSIKHNGQEIGGAHKHTTNAIGSDTSTPH